MSFMNPRSVALPPRPQSLYFAYGSNLQLKQMAKRCPDSQFQGRARLHNFRWQINDRGFANVVPDPDAFVEGLCYLLSPDDEARLDRSEGVPTAYQKKWTEVEFFPAAARLLGRKVTEILRFNLMERSGQPPIAEASRPQTGSGEAQAPYRARDNRPSGAEPPVTREVTEIITYVDSDGRQQAIQQTGTSRRRGQSVPASNRNPTEGRPSVSLRGGTHGEPISVLVYLSENHTKEGLPWDEYIERMNWGIVDAVDLGIPQQYVERAIHPFLLAATGFNANGEPKGRGIRERKKRSRHVPLKKQRRTEEVDAESEQYREQASMQVESMDLDVAQERHDEYYEYQGS